jgi:hypothetical protein
MVSGLKLLSKSSNRLSLNKDNTTIDAKHSEMINYFKKLQESIPLLKEELKKLIFEYNNKDNNRKNDIDYILYRDNLREKINESKNKINSINNNEELNKYYLNVGVLLHSYYENIENSKNIKNNSENFEENLINYEYDLNIKIDEQFDETFTPEIDDEEIDEFDENEEIDEINENENNKKEIKKNNYKNVLNFFNDREIKENEEYDKNNLLNQENNINIENSKNDGVYTSLKISDFVKEESTFKKKNILDEYLQKIDSKYISKIKIDINICKCPNCKTEMIIYPSDGIQICENCGIQQNILIESDKPSFKDPPMEVCYFSYKRINHFNESIGINVKNVINEFYKIFNLLKIIKKMIFNNLYIF